MRIQVLLFVKCGTEFAAASNKPELTGDRDSRDVYTFVSSTQKNIEPVNWLKPVESSEEISPPPGTNFELVEAWVDSLLTKWLYVDLYNLCLIRRLFSGFSSLKYETNFIVEDQEYVSALTNDNLRAIEKLIKSVATITYRDQKEGTLAHFAARRDSPALISVLGNCRADLDAARNDGQLPLHVALREENMDTLLALLDSGADINGKEEYGLTALHMAVLCGNLELVAVLIQRGAYVNTKASDGCSPLHSAALEGETAIVKLLLKSGASIDAKVVGNNKSDGETPLHVALGQAHFESARLLIDNGADYELVCSKGHNALFYGVNRRWWWGKKLIDLLLRLGLDVNNPGNQKAFHLAISRCRKIPTIVEKLILYGFSVPEKNMPEVMLCAIRFNLRKLVKKLLELGADLNQEREFDGDLHATPLRVACRSEQKDRKIFPLLLDHGADPVDAHGSVGRFVVHDVLKLLLDRLFSIRLLSKSEKPGREADVFRELFQVNQSRGSETRRMFATHVMKLKAAGKAAGEDFNPASLDWVFRSLPGSYYSDNYLQKCERELDILKVRTISGTNVELFDLLHIGIDRFTRLLRDRRIRSQMENFNFEQEFHYYGRIIESRLRRATRRRQYLVKGLKAFNRLVIRLPALPMELKEYIVELLANHECAKLDSCFNQK